MNQTQMKRLLNVAAALDDAQENEAFVEIFRMELWGYPVDRDDPETCHQEIRECVDSEVNLVDPWDDEEVEQFTAAVENSIQFLPHNCGAPACALGHYALRRDLQRSFKLSTSGGLLRTDNKDGIAGIMGVTDSFIGEHFGINFEEQDELFGECGCNFAETPEEAARYIRDFVRQKKKE